MEHKKRGKPPRKKNIQDAVNKCGPKIDKIIRKQVKIFRNTGQTGLSEKLVPVFELFLTVLRPLCLAVWPK